jgi:hypothetical protein
MAEESIPLSLIILPGSSISMSTITSTEETPSATERISPASSGTANLVGNVGSTNSNALVGLTVRPKKAKKVTYISIYVYNHLIF